MVFVFRAPILENLQQVSQGTRMSAPYCNKNDVIYRSFLPRRAKILTSGKLSRIDKANFSYGEEFHTELNGGL